MIEVVMMAAVAGAPAPSATTDAKADVVALNAASLRSIEASWLELPASCKARGFNASPTSTGNDVVSAEAAQVYAAFAVS